MPSDPTPDQMPDATGSCDYWCTYNTCIPWHYVYDEYCDCDDCSDEWYRSGGQASQPEGKASHPRKQYNRKIQGNLYNMCLYANF